MLVQVSHWTRFALEAMSVRRFAAEGASQKINEQERGGRNKRTRQSRIFVPPVAVTHKRTSFTQYVRTKRMATIRYPNYSRCPPSRGDSSTTSFLHCRSLVDIRGNEATMIKIKRQTLILFLSVALFDPKRKATEESETLYASRATEIYNAG